MLNVHHLLRVEVNYLYNEWNQINVNTRGDEFMLLITITQTIFHPFNNHSPNMEHFQIQKKQQSWIFWIKLFFFPTTAISRDTRKLIIHCGNECSTADLLCPDVSATVQSVVLHRGQICLIHGLQVIPAECIWRGVTRMEPRRPTNAGIVDEKKGK